MLEQQISIPILDLTSTSHLQLIRATKLVKIHPELLEHQNSRTDVYYNPPQKRRINKNINKRCYFAIFPPHKVPMSNKIT